MNSKHLIDIHAKRLEFDEPSHKYHYTHPSGLREQMVSATTLLKDYFPFDGDRIKKELSESGHPIYGGLTPDEIQALWTAKADLGTDTHLFCEEYLNGDFVSINSNRKMRAFNYMQKMRFEEVITEFRVVAPAWGISGMVDCLVRKKDGWHMYDWKTDKAIRKKSFGKEKCAGILADFDNCNFNKFTFQLGLYTLILDLFYDIQIKSMTIVHIPETGPVKEYTLPYYPEWVGMVVKTFISNRAKESQS